MSEAERLREVLSLIDATDERAKNILYGRLDLPVRSLCDRFGFGAVMDSAARLWYLRDPDGALTVGPCAATVREVLSAKPEVFADRLNALERDNADLNAELTETLMAVADLMDENDDLRRQLAEAINGK